MTGDRLDIEGAQSHDHQLSIRVSCRSCGRKGDATVTHRSGWPIGDAIDEAEAKAAKALIHKPGCAIAAIDNRPTAAGE
jgi:hypothetical protein